MQIVTLTMNPAIDAWIEIDQLTPGRKLRSGTPIYDPGGGGINVARVVHELGGQCLGIYAAGGATGQQLDDLLETRGIPWQRIEIDGRTRQDIAVFEKTSEQLFRLVMPGPELSEREQHKCIDALERLEAAPEYMVVSGSLPPGVGPDFYRRVVRSMKARGTRLIVDTKPGLLRDTLEEGVFLIKPNLRELSELTDRDLKREEEQEQAAQDLVSRGACEFVVVSLGAAGVLLVSRETTDRIRAPSVRVRSKVGAGDSTVGGLTLGLARGLSISKAVRYGVAAGTAAVMTPGTQLCRRQDVEDLFQRIR